MHTHRIQRTHIHTVNGNCTLVNLYFWKGHENNAAALGGESLADASTAAATPDRRGWLSVSISIVQFVQIRMHHFLVDIVAREPEVLVIFCFDIQFLSLHTPSKGVTIVRSFVIDLRLTPFAAQFCNVAEAARKANDSVTRDERRPWP